MEDKNKILFVCEIFKKQQEKNRCNSFGLFDLSTIEFSLIKESV